MNAHMMRAGVLNDKDRCLMSVMVKESPIDEKEMIAAAEKALADISRCATASAASSSARKA